MARLIEMVIVAAVVSLGIIVAGKAFLRAFAMSRRPTHHNATSTGAAPVPPSVDLRPPS